MITEEVKKAIEECNDLAPLHNPANLIGITACEKLMPNTPMTAVFDTAFHQTMPEKAYMYGLPYNYYEIIRSDVTASMEQATVSYLRKRRK